MTYSSSVTGATSTRPGLRQAARRASAFAVLVILAAGVSGCNKLRARDLLNKGVAAFKGGQYDTAIEDFKQAKDLDPSLMNARLYLATAYASQYIPGAPSEQNVRLGTQAVNEFKEVLQLDPNNLSAIDGIGSIIFQMAGTPYDPKKFEESKSYHKKHIELKPSDPEPYYWIGVIDWTLAFRANGELRAEYNKNNIRKQLKDNDPLPPALRAEYAAKYGPHYDDAMAYLNLLYRRKADMVESAEERAKLQKAADDLIDKVKEIKQKRAEQVQPSP